MHDVSRAVGLYSYLYHVSRARWLGYLWGGGGTLCGLMRHNSDNTATEKRYRYEMICRRCLLKIICQRDTIMTQYWPFFEEWIVQIGSHTKKYTYSVSQKE